MQHTEHPRRNEFVKLAVATPCVIPAKAGIQDPTLTRHRRRWIPAFAGMTRGREVLRADGGYSLVELIAALFVLTVGLLGTIQVYHFGLDRIRTMREGAMASRMVQNEIETLRARPFSELDHGENARFISGNPDAEVLVNATPSVTIRPYGSPNLRLKEVCVSLRWTGEHGRTLERAVTTLIADKEAPSS